MIQKTRTYHIRNHSCLKNSFYRENHDLVQYFLPHCAFHRCVITFPVSQSNIIDAANRVYECASNITCFTARLEHATRGVIEG